LGEKGRKGKRREETKRGCDFLQTKVRVSLAYNYIMPVIHVIIINKCRNDFRELEN